MKKFLLVLMVMALSGCAQFWHTYVEEPQNIVQDPHYNRYQEGLRKIEHSYLISEIDYATYLQRKNQLDEVYAQEVQERESKLSGQ